MFVLSSTSDSDSCFTALITSGVNSVFLNGLLSFTKMSMIGDEIEDLWEEKTPNGDATDWYAKSSECILSIVLALVCTTLKLRQLLIGQMLKPQLMVCWAALVI